MKKKIILGVICASLIGIICFLGIKKDDVVNSADSIYPASEETGGIAEKIVGNPDEAEIIVYEYADYGCTHCADWNKTMNNLLEKHGGKIALVFRSYNLGFQNGALAAHAATSAQLQGYFKEYKDLLFEKQTEWLYEEDEPEELFINYFSEVSDGKGDIDKFKEDLNSDAVKKRIDFEKSMGKKVNLRGTPLFRIDGQKIELDKLVETIEEKVNQEK